MEFVSAANARQMVKDYENAINERFLDDLNNTIIEHAKIGLTECCVALQELSKQEKANLTIFLAQHGFKCVPSETAEQPIGYFKIMW